MPDETPGFPRLHPRFKVVALARAEIADTIRKAADSLTYAELLEILSGEMRAWACMAIRDERRESQGESHAG